MDVLVHSIAKKYPEFQLTGTTSIQLGHFTSGNRFIKHKDTCYDDKSSRKTCRKLTCLYYLNPDWKDQDGGQLRIHLNSESWDISPQLDRLVVFRSTDVEHEVLPSFADRLALTVWYYGYESWVSTKPKQQIRPPLMTKPDVTAHSISTRELAALNCENEDRESTIFVSIPSYRDPDCANTIRDLFETATCPNRISIGVCLQSNPVKDEEFEFPNVNVRILHVDYRNASGPCWARAMAQSLYQNETYHLQIDSHMRFRIGWDCYLIDQLNQCPSTKAILTTYPRGFSFPNQVEQDLRPTVLYPTDFDEAKMLKQKSRVVETIPDEPIPSIVSACGFSFSSGQVISSVPYDSTLRFVFFGEEMDRSIRLWTHGWDFFAPTESVVYHQWSREYRASFREQQNDISDRIQQQSLQRIASFQQIGSVRTIDEYMSAIIESQAS